jgi:hypothetical protein
MLQDQLVQVVQGTRVAMVLILVLVKVLPAVVVVQVELAVLVVGFMAVTVA